MEKEKKQVENLESETIEKELEKSKKKAAELLEDQDKLERFMERLERKLKKVPGVGEKISDLPILVNLMRDYIKKEYTDIPIGTIMAILGALIYFVSPIDVIPDAIPVVGYLDDLAVIGYALKLVHDDVEEYKKWKENQKG